MSQQAKLLHLYSRAGFGVRPNELSKLNSTVESAVQDLLNRHNSSPKRVAINDPNPIGLSGDDMMSSKSKTDKQKRQVAKKKMRLFTFQIVCDCIRDMSRTSSPLTYKMLLFWHGHFACQTIIPGDAQEYLDVLLKHGLGNFKDLLFGISKSRAMIRYLNNQQNRVNAPNENFARELLELFTLGEGNEYTEKDIQEAARAFTGWSVGKNGFRVTNKWHDKRSKTIFGKTGNFGGEDVLDLILEKRATALHIVKKVYAFFVNQDINERHVATLARKFYDSDYDIQFLMRELFTSAEFYKPKNIGKQIKSPIELITNLALIFDLKFEDNVALAIAQGRLGQTMLRPPNVAGWPGGRAWIDNSTLLMRLNLPSVIFKKVDAGFNVSSPPEELKVKPNSKFKTTANLTPLVNAFAGKNKEQILDELLGYLLRVPLQMNRKKLMASIIQDNSADFVKSAAIRITSLPEFQVC